MFLILGLFIGAVGTIIGAGGGFILVPILLTLFPFKSASEIAAISMLAVAANATSGSIAYSIKKQVHWYSAFFFTIAATPGIWLGIQLGQLVSRPLFEMIFGLLMVLLSVFLFSKSRKQTHASSQKFSLNSRRLIGGMFLSLGIGVLASFLGIGGGIIHVPLLVTLFSFPVHLAAGTSHFILAITSLIAVTEHFIHGRYNHIESFVPYLIAGLIVGAQVGARVSKKIPAIMIIKILAVALILAGTRLVFHGYYLL